MPTLSTNARTSFAAVLTVLIIAAFALEIASLAGQGAPSPPVRTAGSCAVVVMPAMGMLASGEPAAIRPGDRIELRDADSRARLYFIDPTTRVGDRFVLPIQRAGRVMRVPVTVTQAAAPRTWVAGLIVKSLILLIGLFVLWRGRDRASLWFGTASLCIAIPMYPAADALLPPTGRLSFTTGALVLAEVAAFSLYFMVETLGRGVVRSGTLSIARAIVIGALALTLADDLVSQPSRFLAGCVAPPLRDAHLPAYMLALIVTLAVLALVYARAAGEQRQRLRWIVWSTAIGFSGVIIYIASTVVARPIPLYPVADITAVAIPIGYAYAILRHRVIDVAFVLNRALVFGILSAVIFAAFTLVGKLIELVTVSHEAGLAIELAVACGIALSFDALRLRVRAAVDELFFRDKRRARAALERYIDEAPFMRSGEALFARAVTEICRRLNAETAAIYLGGNGSADYRLTAFSGLDRLPSAVDVDDPAFVTLRASRHELQLGDVKSRLGVTGMAFPLAASGALIGALVCVPPLNAEPYDPDEINLLRTLAQCIAVAYAAIRARACAELVEALASGLVDPTTVCERARAII